LRLYGQAFPARKPLQVINFASVTDGWESDIFSLTLEYAEAAKQERAEIILKLYHGESGTDKASNESEALQLLSDGLFPVPRLILMALEDSPFKQPYVMMEKIAGRKLGDVFLASTPEKQRELLTLFCKLYTDLHALDLHSLVPDSAQYKNTDVIARRLSGMRTFTSELQDQTFDPVLAWLEAKSSDIVREPLSIIHGDFHPGNVLLRDDGAPFVIDWTAMRLSDFRLDLAWTLLLISTERYPALRPTILDEYQRLAGRRVEQIEFFDVIACLRRLIDIYTSLSHGAASMGMKPETEQIMRQRVNQIRNVYTLLQQHTGLSLPTIENLLTSLS